MTREDGDCEWADCRVEGEALVQCEGKELVVCAEHRDYSLTKGWEEVELIDGEEALQMARERGLNAALDREGRLWVLDDDDASPN